MSKSIINDISKRRMEKLLSDIQAEYDRQASETEYYVRSTRSFVRTRKSVR